MGGAGSHARQPVLVVRHQVVVGHEGKRSQQENGADDDGVDDRLCVGVGVRECMHAKMASILICHGITLAHMLEMTGTSQKKRPRLDTITKGGLVDSGNDPEQECEQWRHRQK